MSNKKLVFFSDLIDSLINFDDYIHKYNKPEKRIKTINKLLKNHVAGTNMIISVSKKGPVNKPIRVTVQNFKKVFGYDKPKERIKTIDKIFKLKNG